MNNELFTQTLQRHRLSLTQERRIIFTTLSKLDGPITMGQLLHQVKPQVDRSTVYRTVNLFEKIGILIRVYSGWKYRIELSETFSNHHHHFSCLVCQKIIAFKESTHLEQELAWLEQCHGFQVTAHSLELKGLCDSCST